MTADIFTAVWVVLAATGVTAALVHRERKEQQ